MPDQMPETIGQRLLAAVISYQLGISVDRARKLYVAGREIDPSWEAVGAELLRNFSGCERRRRRAGVRGKERGGYLLSN